MREGYTRPVGHAREPIAERRRWLARIGLALLLVLLGWLLVNRVISPPDDTPQVEPTSSVLPGPL